MKEHLDVLLIARPGRAQNIYEPLLTSGLKFRFISFKLFPKWLKSLTKSRKMQVKGPFSESFLLFTLFDYLRFKPHWKWIGKLGERRLFEFFLKRSIHNDQARLIHYWPNYCYKYISEYKSHHPDVITFADVYLPCEKFIVDEIAPKLQALGVGMNVDYIRTRAEILDELMAGEENFICQSEYVANSYRKYYPQKNYYVISNGLTISPSYKKKDPITDKKQIKSFVYCGKVSVEKGCDLLVDWFAKHPYLQIHLYGVQDNTERNVFDTYKQYSNIYFHGSVPKSILQQKVSLYDAGIHLSRYDAWSIAVGEVLGSGLPVVVSDQTGISELVREYDFGEVCQLTPESITECIMKLITPERYNMCVDNINKYVLSKPKSYGGRIVDFYKEHLK